MHTKRSGVSRIMRLAVGSAAVFTGACYNYANVSPDALRPGMEVRAGITGAGLDLIRREPGQGAFGRLALTGQVVEVVRDTVYLGVPLSTFDGAGGTPDFLKPIALPRAEITRTEERQLDRRKTFVAIAAGSLVTAFAIYRLRGGGVITPTSTMVSPPDNRLPLGGHLVTLAHSHSDNHILRR